MKKINLMELMKNHRLDEYTEETKHLNTSMCVCVIDEKKP